MSRLKIVLLVTFFSSFIGYLEWGGGNHAFVIQAEMDILSKLWTSPASVMHPFTILPLLGQVAFIIVMLSKKPQKRLFYLGIIGLGLLYGMLFFIGLMRLHGKMLLSVLPFFFSSIYSVFLFRQEQKNRINE